MGRTDHEPEPTKNDEPAVWELVLVDMRERDQEGRKKYGTPLQPFNGRKALVDAYQESLDQTVYLRQAIYEWDWLNGRIDKALSLLEALSFNKMSEAMEILHQISAFLRLNDSDDSE